MRLSTLAGGWVRKFYWLLGVFPVYFSRSEALRCSDWTGVVSGVVVEVSRPSSTVHPALRYPHVGNRANHLTPLTP